MQLKNNVLQRKQKRRRKKRWQKWVDTERGNMRGSKMRRGSGLDKKRGFVPF